MGPKMISYSGAAGAIVTGCNLFIHPGPMVIHVLLYDGCTMLPGINPFVISWICLQVNLK